MVTRLSLDFNALRHFYAVAEVGSFTKAARALHRTQPAVSYQIKGLEKAVGRALLARSREGVTLTPHGLILFEVCKDVFARLDEAQDRIADLAHEAIGTVRVGCPGGIFDGWLARRLVAFARANPMVDLSVIVGSDETIRTLLVERRLDAGLLIGGVARRQESLVLTRVDDEEYVLVSSPAAVPRGRLPAALAGKTFIAYQEGDVMLQLWMNANAPGMRERIHLRHLLNHMTGIIALVEAGLGLAVLPRHAVGAHVAAGSLVEIPGPKGPVANPFYLATPRLRRPPLKVTRLVELLTVHPSSGSP